MRAPHLTLAVVVFGTMAPVARSQDATGDTLAARKLFEANIAAIHRRDRAAYLATYLESARLARNGPGGLELGFNEWAARRDTTWPDTLVARDLRVVPIAPGVVYGTYHYRVTQRGVTTEGRSERVITRTPGGWRIAVSTAFPLAPGSYPPPVAIVGATLVNPGEAPVPDAIIVTRNGRIQCAGPRSSCQVPAEAERVDAKGRWVIPGLVDAHVHYSQTGWVDGRPDARDLRSEFPYDSIVGALRREADRFHRAFLCSGVTSAFDVGGFAWTIPMAQRTVSQLDAPRVVAAGPLLTTRDHWLNTPSMKQFIFMTDDSTTRRAIQANRTFGGSATKVWYIQVAEPLRAGARAQLMAAGEESRRAGLPLIVHATQLARAKEALQAGASLLVHSVDTDTIDDEFIQLARANRAIVSPTLTVSEGYDDVRAGRSPGARYPLACVDHVTRAKLERVLPSSTDAVASTARAAASERRRAIMYENIRRLKAAGIPIAMGTDAGNPGTAHGPSVYREMLAMRDAGMSPAEILSASTLVSARAAGIESDAGSVTAGKRADLVMLAGDPLADIAALQQVTHVMRNGALHGRGELLPR